MIEEKRLTFTDIDRTKMIESILDIVKSNIVSKYEDKISFSYEEQPFKTESDYQQYPLRFKLLIQNNDLKNLQIFIDVENYVRWVFNWLFNYRMIDVTESLDTTNNKIEWEICYK